MAQTPTSKSAPINNAAKDDHVGGDGDFTFTIADLLANDPGGAAKTPAQFFFGTAEWQFKQAEYLELHGIIDNHDGTYTLKSDATFNDFDYMVQIGNKGTWSLAHVTVDDRPEPPPPPPVEHCSEENIVANSTFAGVIMNDQDWAITPIIGWDNTGTGSDHAIEAWNDIGLDHRTNGHLVATAGGFVIETDGWGEGNPNPVNNTPVQDVYQTNVDAVDGEAYLITFNYASRS